MAKPSSKGMVVASPQLTPRELQILRLIAQGLSNKEVGKVLSVTEGTVKVHVHHTFLKLGVSSRIGAIAKGLKRHLL
jgi:two-component system, NarL family, nitrate/nitrite response regulator NarL